MVKNFLIKQEQSEYLRFARSKKIKIYSKDFIKYLALVVIMLIAGVNVSDAQGNNRNRVILSRNNSQSNIGGTIVNGIANILKKKNKKKDIDELRNTNNKETNFHQEQNKRNGTSSNSERQNLNNKSHSKAKENSDVELVVTGDGATKQAATLSALRSALEQTYGTMVSSNTKILNDELVKDEIVSISTGVVKKYTYMSEKEIGGKWYVVLKALVSTQKLISYAQSKGASVELAGATFAANVRLQQLNEKNAGIARSNISKMQERIFPSCLDFVITEMKGPGKVYSNRDYYSIRFNIEVRFNSNAKQIQDLEALKPPGVYYSDCYFLRSIFENFKIVDNLNEYFFKRVEDYLISYKLCKKTILPNSAEIDLFLGHQTRGKDFIYEGAHWLEYFYIHRNRHFIWERVVPNRTIAVFKFYLTYKSLDEIEKITGINVVLKNSEQGKKVSTMSANVPQSVSFFFNTDSQWKNWLSLSEEEVIQRVDKYRSAVFPQGNGELTGKRVFTDEQLDALIQEYRKAKK